MSRLDQHVAAVQNRLAVERFLHSLAWTAMACAGIALVMVLLDRLFQLHPAQPIYWLIGGLSAAVIAAAVFAVRRRPTRHQAAAAIDAKLGLNEKISTALFVRPSNDPFAMAAVLDAEATAQNVVLHAGQHFPLKFPRPAIGTSLVAAAAALCLLLPTFDLLGRQEQQKKQEVQKQKVEFAKRQLQDALAVVNAVPQSIANDEVIKLAKKDIATQLHNGGEDPAKASRTALKALQDVDAAVKQQIKTNVQYAQSKADEKMWKQIGDQPIAEPGPINEVRKELAEGKFSEAVNDLSNVVNNFDKMDKKEQEKAAEQMKQLAQQLQQQANNPQAQLQAQQQMQQMGMSQQQAQQAQQLMQQAANGSQQAQQQLQQMAQQAMQQMNNGQGPTQQQKQQLQQMMQQAQAAANNQAQAQQMAQAAQQMAQAMQQQQQAQQQAQQQGGAQQAQQKQQAAQQGQRTQGQRTQGQGTQGQGTQGQGKQGGQQGQQGSQQAGQQQSQMGQGMAQMQQQLQQMQAVAADAQQMAAAQQAAQNGAQQAMAGANGAAAGAQGADAGQGGQGAGNQGQPGGQWNNNGGQQQGGGPQGGGKGFGSRGNKVEAPYTVKEEISPSQRIETGKLLATTYVKAGTIKGESKEQLKEVAAEAQKEATDEIDQERVSRQAQKVVREYFNSMQHDETTPPADQK